MSAIPKRKIETWQYLENEKLATFKSEYYDGEVYAMAGVSRFHHRLAANLYGLLYSSFKDHSCTYYTSDMKVRTSATKFSYPDASIVCGGAEYADDDAYVLFNPMVIFEIESPSTAAFDRGGKFEMYKGIPSFREYVLIAQNRIAVDHFVKAPDGSWKCQELRQASDLLRLETPGVELPLSSLYENVELSSK